MSTRKVRLDFNRRGDEDIQLPDQDDSRVTCETLEEAERVAHVCATYQQPCELAECDAYNRALNDASADRALQTLELVMLAADSA
jgi:hypothetical protein